MKRIKIKDIRDLSIFLDENQDDFQLRYFFNAKWCDEKEKINTEIYGVRITELKDHYILWESKKPEPINLFNEQRDAINQALHLVKKRANELYVEHLDVKNIRF